MRYEHEVPAAHRHQEAWAHRQTQSSRDRQPARLGRWCRLGDVVRGHRRSCAYGLHCHAFRREEAQAVAFLHKAVANHVGLGVCVKRLLTANGSAFRSEAFAAACKALGVQHKFARPYRPMARPSGSSSQCCASVPMAGRTRTQPSGPMPWRAGSTTTTGIDRTAASVKSLRSPGPILQATSWLFTAS